MLFTDRASAGALLARKLSSYGRSFHIVFGLSRGGVVVAKTVSVTLHLPLGVIVVQKIPSPGNSELAIGAVAPDGVRFIDMALAERMGADKRYIRTQNSKLNDQIKQKISLYRKTEEQLGIKGKTVIVVDDGAATGATMQAAIAWLKKKKAGKIIAALPVAPVEFIGKITEPGVSVVVLETPQDFSSVGQWYTNFPQISDEEVIQLLTVRP